MIHLLYQIFHISFIYHFICKTEKKYLSKNLSNSTDSYCITWRCFFLILFWTKIELVLQWKVNATILKENTPNEPIDLLLLFRVTSSPFSMSIECCYYWSLGLPSLLVRRGICKHARAIDIFAPFFLNVWKSVKGKH